MSHPHINRVIRTLIIFIVILNTNFYAQELNTMEKEMKAYLNDLDQKIGPLFTETNTAYFKATISGKPEDYKKWENLSIAMSKIYSDKEIFARLTTYRESNQIRDGLLRRQLEKYYLSFAGNQYEPELLEKIISMQTMIENKYATYRTKVGEKELSDNEVENLLKTSLDSRELQNVWEASKQIGPAVAHDVLELVKLRNQAAKSLGYNNYHTMALSLGEQNPEEISALMDELDGLTRGAFQGLKGEIDQYLAERLKIAPAELRPWHYQNRYFQEAPKIYDLDLDAYYAKQNLETLTKDYYASIGLPIDELVAKSDLYEKPGKYQHAYCTHIDREGDVRVVCNIRPNYNWMGTMLHEYGHAVYDRYLSFSIPWILREPAHTFTTEAIAMLFGRLASNPYWIQAMTGISDDEVKKIEVTAGKTLRMEQLIFSRWVQVVYRFEKAMYENPDQDLNTLWWDLVEKYQMVKKPEGRTAPDWVTKIHIALYPAYYHNYLMGELLASQLHYHIEAAVVKSSDKTNLTYKGNNAVGAYLTEMVFKPAALFPWNTMIERATGEKLTARYYAKQFVD